MSLNNFLEICIEDTEEESIEESDLIPLLPSIQDFFRKTPEEVRAMLRDVEDNSKFRNVAEGYTLMEHGYIDPKKIYGSSPQKVVQKLHILLSEDYPVVDERILLQLHEADAKREEAFLLNPVLMAVFLKEYELAEKLLQKGYLSDDRFMEKQIYMKKNYETDFGDSYDWYDISITQLLMERAEIPESLRKRICDELSQLGPVFDYKYDCWLNPFLRTAQVSDESYLGAFSFEGLAGFPLEGLEAVYKTAPELLEGMFTDENAFGCFDSMGSRDIATITKLFEALLTYFWGMTDLEPIIREWGRFCLKNIMDSGEAREAWWKLFPRVREACEYNEKIRDICIRCLLGDYNSFHIGYGDVMSPPGRKRTIQHHLKRVEKALGDLCTEEYTQENLLDFLYDSDTNFNLYSSFDAIYTLRLWKHKLKRTFYPMRFDYALVKLLRRVLTFEEETGASEHKNESRKEKCLQQAIEFIELMDGVTYEECPLRDFTNVQADFMNMVLKLESEELLSLCMEKNLIPQELLPVVADSVLELGYTRLMPYIIYLQSQKGVS